MRPFRSHWIAVLLAAAFVAAGCGSTSRTDAQTPSTARPAPTSPDGATLAELEAIYRARMDSVRSVFTEADVHFMTGMIGHHAQALVMSALAPTHGASPSVQTLAARIMNAQRDEIATMQTWLRERGQPVPEVHIDGLDLMIHGAGHHGTHMDMPGMLTSAQIKELDAARGAAFDALFLRYMIQHHGGAVVMVDDLFAIDGAAQDDTVFKFASDVQVDQRTEIARMQLMLDAITDGDDAP